MSVPIAGPMADIDVINLISSDSSDISDNDESAIDLCDSSSQAGQSGETSGEQDTSTQEQLLEQDVTSPAQPCNKMGPHEQQMNSLRLARGDLIGEICDDRAEGSGLASQPVTGRQCSSCAGREGGECQSLSARRLGKGQDDVRVSASANELAIPAQRLEHRRGRGLKRPSLATDGEQNSEGMRLHKRVRAQHGSCPAIEDATQAAPRASPEMREDRAVEQAGPSERAHHMEIRHPRNRRVKRGNCPDNLKYGQAVREIMPEMQEDAPLVGSARQNVKIENESSEDWRPRQKRRVHDGSCLGSQHSVQPLPKTFPEMPEDDPHVGQAGQLASIELENFKNHEHFKMDFTPRVNVITGTNGSGKSAILGATQLALGAIFSQTGGPAGRGRVCKGPTGSTTRTGHGEGPSNVSAVVRTGAASAVVRVTLWNTGPDGFKPQVYGPRVTIERRIHRGGSSNWKIKDFHGAMVSERRQEIDDFLFHVNINMANPVVCLTQAMAQAFTSNSPKQLFNMYMEAMRFKETEYKNAQSTQFVLELKESVKALHGEIKEMEDKLSKVKTSLHRLKNIEESQRHVDTLVKACAWEVVFSLEATVQQCQAKLLQYPQFVQKKKDALTQLESKLQEEKETKERLTVELSTFATQIEQLSEQWRKYTEDARQIKAEVKAAKKALKQEQQNLDRNHDEKQSLLAARESQIEDASAASKEDHQKLLQDLGRLEQERDAAQAQVDAAAQYMKEREMDLTAAQARLRESQTGLRTSRATVATCTARVSDLQAQRRNPLAAFGGPAAIGLNAAIARYKNRFTRLPIGPIGSHLKLKDPKWGKAVEASIGHIFNSYVVHCHEDCQTLKGVSSCREKFGNLQIISYNFDVPMLNLSDGRFPPVPDKYFTVLKALIFPDEQGQAVPLRNVLIDSTHLERLVLVQTEEEARSLSRDKFGPLQKGTAYTIWAPSGFYADYKGETVTHYPPRPRRPPRLLRDDETPLKEAEEDLKVAQEQQAAAEQAYAKHQECVKTLTKELQDARSQKRLADGERLTRQSQLEEHQTQLDSASLGNMFEEWQREWDALELEDQQIQSRVQEAQQKLDEAEGRYSRAEQEHRDLKSAHRESVALNERKEEQLAAVCVVVGDLEEGFAKGNEELEMIHESARQTDAKCREYREALPGYVATALEQFCPREEGLQAIQLGQGLLEERSKTCNTRGSRQDGRSLQERLIALKDELKAEIAERKRFEGGVTHASMQAEQERLLARLAERTPIYNKLRRLYVNFREAVSERRKRYTAMRNCLREQVSRGFAKCDHPGPFSFHGCRNWFLAQTF
eukprot:jgi/Botrbrau1/11510/Bobra.0198s0007.2